LVSLSQKIAILLFRPCPPPTINNNHKGGRAAPLAASRHTLHTNAINSTPELDFHIPNHEQQ
jgi:hypothetical protein